MYIFKLRQKSSKPLSQKELQVIENHHMTFCGFKYNKQWQKLYTVTYFKKFTFLQNPHRLICIHYYTLRDYKSIHNRKHLGTHWCRTQYWHNMNNNTTNCITFAVRGQRLHIVWLSLHKVLINYRIEVNILKGNHQNTENPADTTEWACVSSFEFQNLFRPIIWLSIEV